MAERRVKLTDDQFERLQKDRRTIDTVGHIAGEALVVAAELVSERERHFWSSVRECANCAMESVVKIDWLNREVVVQENDDTSSRSKSN